MWRGCRRLGVEWGIGRYIWVYMGYIEVYRGYIEVYIAGGPPGGGCVPTQGGGVISTMGGYSSLLQVGPLKLPGERTWR